MPQANKTKHAPRERKKFVLINTLKAMFKLKLSNATLLSLFFVYLEGPRCDTSHRTTTRAAAKPPE